VAQGLMKRIEETGGSAGFCPRTWSKKTGRRNEKKGNPMGCQRSYTSQGEGEDEGEAGR